MLIRYSSTSQNKQTSKQSLEIDRSREHVIKGEEPPPMCVVEVRAEEARKNQTRVSRHRGKTNNQPWCVLVARVDRW